MTPARDDARVERRVVAGAALAAMLAPLNSTMIAVALPSIRAQFQVGVGSLAWLVTGYLVVMASLQPVAGRLGDRLGRRPLLLGGLALFAFASVAAANAPGFAWLVAARLLQAAAASLALPNASALLRVLVPAVRRGRVFGWLGTATSLAAATGPLLAGLLISMAGWQAIFWVNLALVVPSVLLVHRAMPDSQTASRPGPGSAFDFAGAAALSAILGSGATLVVLTRHYGPLQIAEAVTLAAVAVGFVFYEARQAVPVLQPRLFRRRAFSAAASGIALGNFTMYVSLLTVPILMASRRGWTAAGAGWLLTAMTGAQLVCAPCGGWLADARGRRAPAVAGLGGMSAGAVLLAVAGGSVGIAQLAVGLALIGGGIGLAGAALQTAACESVTAADAGLALGMYSTSRYLGSILGSSLLAQILQRFGDVPSTFGGVFDMIALAALLSAVAGLGVPGRAPAVSAPPAAASADTL